ncbi:MAG: hypothetical protein DPW09_27350 [Anaerolineae bacterium]|nr:hypothetical protein [Anaerolineales bacterium]MCQ3977161.1 hypothetical protein [Anaerolineae bacterium]
MKKGFVLFLATIMLFTLGCGMLNSWLGLSGSAGTVSELWSDVPPLEGATKADLEIPLVFQLMIQAVAKSGINYIAFTTPKTPTEVKSFYTPELMQANGWQTVQMEGGDAGQQGCVADQANAGSDGAFCLFSKGEGDKQTLLAIIIAQDEQSQQTSIFYARVEGGNIDLQITPASQGAVPAHPISFLWLVDIM